MKILYPFLKGLATAFDVRCYLEHNTPLWSLENEERDKKTNVLLYEQIKQTMMYCIELSLTKKGLVIRAL